MLLLIVAYPQVKSMGRSKNIVAGDTLDLNCRTWGWPAPIVNWTRQDGLMNLTDPRVSLPNSTTLRIEVFTCMVLILRILYLY